MKQARSDKNTAQQTALRKCDHPGRKQATVGKSTAPPVDTEPPQAHFADVDQKPHKVEEPQAIYAAKKPVTTAPAPQKGFASAEFDLIADKLLRERKELLHKLAQ